MLLARSDADKVRSPTLSPFPSHCTPSSSIPPEWCPPSRRLPASMSPERFTENFSASFQQPSCFPRSQFLLEVATLAAAAAAVAALAVVAMATVAVTEVAADAAPDHASPPPPAPPPFSFSSSTAVITSPPYPVFCPQRSHSRTKAPTSQLEFPLPDHRLHFRRQPALLKFPAAALIVWLLRLLRLRFRCMRLLRLQWRWLWCWCRLQRPLTVHHLSAPCPP